MTLYSHDLLWAADCVAAQRDQAAEEWWSLFCQKRLLEKQGQSADHIAEDIRRAAEESDRFDLLFCKIMRERRAAIILERSSQITED